MKPCRHILLICLVAVLPVCGYAQSALADSLQEVLKGVGDREKPAVMNQLVEIYRVNKNHSGAEALARRSAALALATNNYTEATKAYTLLVDIRINAQQFAGLKPVSDSALLLAKQANDPVAMAYGYYSQALLYKMLDNGEEVVRYCNHALKALETADNPFITAKVYYRLYGVYSGWNNEARIGIYARKTTENALRTNDYNLLSNGYMALSVSHEYNLNAGRGDAQRDSMLYYLYKVDTLYREHPGRVAAFTYGIACVNIASCYLKYFPVADGEARVKGIHFANMARNVLSGVPNCQEVIASSLGILSEYAGRAGNDAQVGKFLLEAYDIMKTQQPPYYHTMINVVQALSAHYAQKGDYRRALEFQQEVTAYNLKNFNHRQAVNAQKLEIQFDTEKKANEMRVLKEQEKSRRLQNYLYGYTALAAILGLLLVYRAYRNRARFAAQKEKQLQLERQEAALQLKLEKEEQARLKTEQQLLEARQHQLKKEVMANALQLEHKNRTLLNIKDKLAEGERLNMQKIIKEEMLLDSNFEQAKLQIQEVHPDFFYLVSEKAQRKLTLLDLKLCAYMYLQMDTRQIAQLMHIEPKSVRMSRYRIKQKLGLDKEDDLYAFLQRLEG